MLTQIQKTELEKQQYRFVGSHSAVKVCGWTKEMMREGRGCYKFKFYGIRSHQCMQMTTAMFCANRCTFCWRGEKAPVQKTWSGVVDDPTFIITESKKAHLKLLEGFNGNENAVQHYVSEHKDIKHVALSLTGEPIAYPRINELLSEFHDAKISTFLVTNAQFPEAIENLSRCTQLYISVDAPNKELLQKVDVPLFPDYYERLLRSLDALALKDYRTCVRLTMVKGLNDVDILGYKSLIERGNPDFIEVKGYMYVGASQKFLKRENMPDHSDVKEFTLKLAEVLPDYSIVSDHEASKAVCMMKKGMKQYIDFQRFFTGAKEYSSDKMMPN